MTRSMRLALLACTAAVLLPAPALAHGGLEDVHPRFAQRVAKAPKTVWVRFEKPPARPAFLRVKDGCDDPVAGRVRISGKTMEVPIRGGKPGNWAVEFSAIAPDGHREAGDWAFKVAGDPCGRKPADENGEAAGPPEVEDDEDSGVPVGSLLIAAGAVVAAVLIIRVAR